MTSHLVYVYMYIYICTYTPYFLNPFIHWQTFRLSPIRKDVSVNMGVQMPFSGNSFVSFAFILRSRIAGSYGVKSV